MTSAPEICLVCTILAGARVCKKSVPVRNTSQMRQVNEAVRDRGKGVGSHAEDLNVWKWEHRPMREVFYFLLARTPAKKDKEIQTSKEIVGQIQVGYIGCLTSNKFHQPVNIHFLQECFDIWIRETRQIQIRLRFCWRQNIACETQKQEQWSVVQCGWIS